MKAHYKALASIFLEDRTTLFAADVVAVFKSSGLSLTGSERRRGETRTIAYWRDWLLQVEGKKVPNINTLYCLCEVFVRKRGKGHLNNILLYLVPWLNFTVN